MKPFYENAATGVTIFCGRWEEVWPTLCLKPSDVDLCWADPPYGIGVVERSDGRRKGNKPGPTWRPVDGDARPFDPAPLLAFPRLVTWGANYYSDRLPASSAWWTWDKKCQPWECDQADGELAWTNLGGPPRIHRLNWIAGANEGSGPRIHPTQKPVALCEWGFKRAGLKRGDLVFSPYLGSGPEVRAALNMGLRLIGCELVPEYCEAVVRHRTGLARYVEGQAALF